MSHSFVELLPIRKLPVASDLAREIPRTQDSGEDAFAVGHDYVVHAISHQQRRRLILAHPRRRHDHRLVRHRTTFTIERNFLEPPLQGVSFRDHLRVRLELRRNENDDARASRRFASRASISRARLPRPVSRHPKPRRTQPRRTPTRVPQTLSCPPSSQSNNYDDDVNVNKNVSHTFTRNETIKITPSSP